VFFVASFVISGSASGTPNSAPVEGVNGAVATEHPLCSDIGLKILKKGGSAVDSAIASGLCIGTVNSFSSGIGGYVLFRLLILLEAASC
jgi:gamma-glutamyltranspeptidase